MKRSSPTTRGDLSAIDDVPVRQRSGAFLEHAWDVLRTVPAGAPVTYTEYAAKSGRPTAIRAAASACARNAAALFVPCHRVLRTDGTLGGFRWGLPVKRALLEHERWGSGHPGCSNVTLLRLGWSSVTLLQRGQAPCCDSGRASLAEIVGARVHAE